MSDVMLPGLPGFRRPVALQQPDDGITRQSRHFPFPMALCEAVDHASHIKAFAARRPSLKRLALFAILLRPVDHIYTLVIRSVFCTLWPSRCYLESLSMVDDERFSKLKTIHFGNVKPKQPKQRRRPTTIEGQAKRNANLKPKKKSPTTAMSKEARREENRALWREGRQTRHDLKNDYFDALASDLAELYAIQKELWRIPEPTQAHRIRSQMVEAAIDRIQGRSPHTFAGSIQHRGISVSLDGTAFDAEGEAVSPLLADAMAHDHAASEAKQLRSPAMKTIDVVAEPISEQPFIVDPVGNIAAPVASAGSAPPDEPDPEPEVEAQQTPPPFFVGAPVEPPFPCPGAPANFRIHMRERQQRAIQSDANTEYMRKRQEAARLDPQRYPGGCIPMAELRSDVEEGRMNRDQGTMEIVRFGRVPGGEGFSALPTQSCHFAHGFG